MLGFLKRRGDKKPGAYGRQVEAAAYFSADHEPDADLFEELSLDALLQSDVVRIMMNRDGITDKDIRLLAAYTSQKAASQVRTYG